MTIKDLEKPPAPKPSLNATEKQLIEVLKREGVVLIVYRHEKKGHVSSGIQMTDSQGYITEESWFPRGEVVIAKTTPKSALNILTEYLGQTSPVKTLATQKAGGREIDVLKLNFAGNFDKIYGLFSHIPAQIVETTNLINHGHRDWEAVDTTKVEAIEFVNSRGSKSPQV